VLNTEGVEWFLRFLLGGAFVSLFSVIGESIKPKSFAGLFGAAPSISLAGLILVYIYKGEQVALIETRSMIYGSLALAAYCLSCSTIVQRSHIPPWLSAGLLWFEWFAIAFLLEAITR
jgi:hypothetical protein